MGWLARKIEEMACLLFLPLDRLTEVVQRRVEVTSNCLSSLLANQHRSGLVGKGGSLGSFSTTSL
jgi:hypothetical protein